MKIVHIYLCFTLFIRFKIYNYFIMTVASIIYVGNCNGTVQIIRAQVQKQSPNDQILKLEPI
jgi:hypothetical protein